MNIKIESSNASMIIIKPIEDKVDGIVRVTNDDNG